MSPERRDSVVSALVECARQSRHGLVRNVHVLTSDLGRNDGLVVRCARRCGVDVDAVRKVVSARLERLPIAGDRQALPILDDEVNDNLSRVEDTGHPVGLERLALEVLLDARDETARTLRTMGLSVRNSDLSPAAAAAPLGTSREGPARAPKQPPSTPVLSQIARDLTELAGTGAFQPILGRDAEVRELETILSQMLIRNALLLGEPGVGKTALVEEVARRACLGEIPGLENVRFHELDMAALMADTQHRGSFEGRFRDMLSELERTGGVLFIDELHMLAGAGGGGPGVDALNLLKPVLARGRVQVIGATTRAEHRQYLEKDQAFERRFQLVHVEEPGTEQTLAILQRIAPRHGEYHGLEITTAVLERIVEWTHRHMSDRRFPDKAIQVLDRACARQRILGRGAEATGILDVDTVAHVVAGLARIPIERVAGKVGVLIDRLSGEPEADGQPELLAAVGRAFATSSGNRRTRMVLTLRSGSGRACVDLARAMARVLSGGEDRCVAISLDQCSDERGIDRLIGAAPGLVGFEEGGALTEPVRRHPHAVVLLDSIDQAHPTVLGHLEHILHSGVTRDGRHREVRFGEVIVLISRTAAGTPSDFGGRGNQLQRVFECVDSDIDLRAMSAPPSEESVDEARVRAIVGP